MTVRHLAPIVFLVACSSGEADKSDTTDTQTNADTSSDSSGDADTDADADADADAEPATVDGAFFVGDLATGAPLAGADLTYDTQATTLDADGNGTVTLAANAPYSVFAAAADYPPLEFRGFAGAEAVSMGRYIPSYATLDLLGGVLGLDYDPTKGLISLNIITPDGTDAFAALPGVTSDIDAGYELVLVNDASSFIGFSEGNTTLEGSSSGVMFVNVDTGPMTLTVTPPTGFTCTVFSDTAVADANLVATADTISTISIICE